MSEGNAEGWRGRLRRKRPRLYDLGKLLLVLMAIGLFVVGVLPDVDLPGVGLLKEIPFPDLPDLPDWARWLRRSVVIVIVVLALVGALEKRGKRDRPERADED